MCLFATCQKSATRQARTPEQARRTRSLIKQAADALTLMDEETLNIDSQSLDALIVARANVSQLEIVVARQPIKKSNQ